jgi:hypothetical protein
MAYDITQLQSDLESTLHGTNLSSLQNIYNLIFRGAAQLLLDLDPQETKRIVELPSPIYKNIYDYALPADVKGNKIVDIRPQLKRNFYDNPRQTFNRVFDLNKGTGSVAPSFTMNFDSGIKTIRIDNQIIPQGILIDSGSYINENGTYTVGGSATDLTTDNINFVSPPQSLRFNLSAGADPSSGYIENTTLTPVDLSFQNQESSIFIPVYLPTASNFVSIKLDWGSSTANYFSRTVTTTHENTVFQNGWNMIRFDWKDATTTGTPDDSAINFIKLTFNYNGTAMNGVRINNIQSILGSIYEVEYYSKYLFRDATTGAFKETPTEEDDLINLDTESYHLLLNRVAYLAAQQNGGGDAGYDVNFFLREYALGLQRYKSMYKSEIIKPQQQYYSPTRRSGRGFRRGNI